MAQSEMDGGSGGWNTFFGGVIESAGKTLADKVSGGGSTSGTAEKTADKTLTEDIQGPPTVTQRTLAGGVSFDARTIMVVGGVLMVATVAILAMKG